MRVELLLEADQRRVLETFRRIRDERADTAPYVAADPAWPTQLIRQAATDLDKATRTGRVTRGDLVLFTSGSTGRPRAVVRSWASWEASLGPLTTVTGLGAGDVVWLPGALSSSLFLYGAYHADAVGAAMVLRDEQVSQDITAAHCVPTQAAGILGRIGRGELPGLRTLIVAGDRMGAEAWRTAEAHAVRVIEYYGAAELSFVGLRDQPGPLRPFPEVEVEGRRPGEAAHEMVAAPSGPAARRREGPGRTGLAAPGRADPAVLWCRSPYLSRGYLDPDRDGPLRRDPDGWASVGDLVVPAGPGFDVVGRGEDAVTIGGHTVLVCDVEDEIRRLPGVREVAVVGLPHIRLGASLAAMVAVDPEVTVQWLRSAARDSEASGWSRVSRPRRWLVVDHLPRTPGGKVDRAAVRRAVTATGEGAGPSPAPEARG